MEERGEGEKRRNRRKEEITGDWKDVEKETKKEKRERRGEEKMK